MNFQERTLHRIHARNSSNAFWAWAGRDRAISPARMRHAPVTDYDSVRPWVDRIRSGEPEAHRAFGPSPVVVIAQTSGTSSEPKRLPLNRDFVASYRRFMTGLNLSLARDGRSPGFLFRGKRLVLTARAEVSRAPNGMMEGFMSGQMALQAPRWMRALVLPRREILQLPDWESKLEPMLREAKDHDVRVIAGVPSMLLSFSEKACEYYGVRRLSDVWPNLRATLFGGVVFTEAGRSRLADLWHPRRRRGFRDGEVFFWEMYSATEGVFGHTLNRVVPGMVFNDRENFYQFRESPEGPFLQLHELRAGGRYLVYVTTYGGLVNYDMGDWIEVLGMNPPSFRVYGRLKEELSLAGEKISIGQAREAVERTLLGSGTHLHDFVCWVEEGRPNRLVCGLGLEGEAGASSNLARRFDLSLSAVNSAYEELRIDDFVFGSPRLVEIPQRIFRRYQLAHIDEGQFKGRRLFRSEAEFRHAYRVDEKESFRVLEA